MIYHFCLKNGSWNSLKFVANLNDKKEDVILIRNIKNIKLWISFDKSQQSYYI